MSCASETALCCAINSSLVKLSLILYNKDGTCSIYGLTILIKFLQSFSELEAIENVPFPSLKGLNLIFQTSKKY